MHLIANIFRLLKCSVTLILWHQTLFFVILYVGLHFPLTEVALKSVSVEHFLNQLANHPIATLLKIFYKKINLQDIILHHLTVRHITFCTKLDLI